MWKTEGYFGDVVWRNHVRDCECILDFGDDGGEGGGGDGEADGSVLVRPMDVGGEDGEGGVRETVEWAVGVILEQMRG